MSPEEKQRRLEQRKAARALAKDARTFRELCAVYGAFFGLDGLDADRIERLAMRAAADRPEALWGGRKNSAFPVLEDVLLYTAQSYDPEKWLSFEKLFEMNLRQRLKRDAARNAQDAHRERWSIRKHNARLQDDSTEVEVAFKKWTHVLYGEAVARLGPDASYYISLRLAGMKVKAIAKELGVTEKTLRNRFGYLGMRGGDHRKLTALVREKVNELVKQLPPYHRKVLVRHLLDEAGLPQHPVERLLGMSIEGLKGGDILLRDETDVLELLGWKNWSGTSGGVPRSIGSRAA
jgi:hypothetical protein